MKIGFLCNKLTLRGTEVCMFDYADYNEKMLGNQSIIITRDYYKLYGARDLHKEAYNKFNNRFCVLYYDKPTDLEEIVEKNNIDILYIIKAGEFDDLIVNNCKTAIHCVFGTKQPHGTVYCCISEFVNYNNQTNYPVLHHMVRVDESTENLRNELCIPDNAIVFGSYSGADEYTDTYVKEVVKNVSQDPKYSNIYFIYMNIDEFGIPNSNLRFLPGTSDMKRKRMFINTCDAMLYGRGGGETFGLAVGEFSICNKPIIGKGNTTPNYHITTLGDDMIKHYNYEQCYDIVTNWGKYKKDVSNNGYKKFTPEFVMNEFKNIVIDS